MTKLDKLIDKLDKNTRLKGALFLLASLFTMVSLVSYHSSDACLNVVSNDPVKNLCGRLGAIWADILLQYFGAAACLALPFGFYISYRMLRKTPPKFMSFKFWCTLIAVLALATILGSFSRFNFKYPFLLGGAFGYFVNSHISNAVIKVVVVLFSILLLVMYPYSVFLFGKKTPRYHEKNGKSFLKLFIKSLFKLIKIVLGTPFKWLRKIFSFKRQKVDNAGMLKGLLGLKHATDDEEKDVEENSSREDVVEQYFDHEEDARRSFVLPSVSLLKDIKNTNASQTALVCRENMQKLEKILGDFGIRGKMISFQTGPIVTLYEFQIQPGVKSSRVISLCDDIARTMKVSSVRISTLVGKDTLGIEVPNQSRSIVCFRHLLESYEYKNSDAYIPMTLGCNIFGKPVVADLTSMPHLLIAGTTGSGKSVGINGMILSMLFKLKPEQCRFIMIDPKMLEFSAYDGIPHLLMPVITDPKDAVSSLKWVVKEMEDRYRKMSEAGVRNINGYNKKVELENENRREKEAKLPYIVVIIDEMADLMVVAGKEIEVLVQRLSQMARAAGIHLIMATQRPSVDVITGVIKANFPTRISYQVTSKIDSRTILGEQGAEQLLGKGDMLFMIGGTKTARVHGPMIEDSEVEEVVKFLKKNGAPEYISIVDEDSDDGFVGSFAGSDGDDEGLYRKAVKIVLEEKKTSISYLQRKMRIGYNKAANLIEQMEEEGILSSPDVQGKRRILVKTN